jgi:hypothetical protein
MHTSNRHSHSLNLTRSQNVPEATLFLRNTKQYNHLRYISFKTVPLRSHTLLPAIVKVLEIFQEVIFVKAFSDLPSLS